MPTKPLLGDPARVHESEEFGGASLGVTRIKERGAVAQVQDGNRSLGHRDAGAMASHEFADNFAQEWFVPDNRGGLGLANGVAKPAANLMN